MKPGKTKKMVRPPLKEICEKNIVAYREMQGLKQQDLVNKLGKPQQYVSRLEAGKQNVTLETLELVGDALDVPAWSLLSSRVRPKGPAKR